jgi:DNA-binding MarR family transcriptional regulator
VALFRTPAGRSVFDQAHPDLLATEATLLDGLPRQDRADLSRLLAKLAANLEIQNKPA